MRILVMGPKQLNILRSVSRVTLGARPLTYTTFLSTASRWLASSS